MEVQAIGSSTSFLPTINWNAETGVGTFSVDSTRTYYVTLSAVSSKQLQQISLLTQDQWTKIAQLTLEIAQLKTEKQFLKDTSKVSMSLTKDELMYSSQGWGVKRFDHKDSNPAKTDQQAQEIMAILLGKSIVPASQEKVSNSVKGVDFSGTKTHVQEPLKQAQGEARSKPTSETETSSSKRKKKEKSEDEERFKEKTPINNNPKKRQESSFSIDFKKLGNRGEDESESGSDNLSSTDEPTEKQQMNEAQEKQMDSGEERASALYVSESDDKSSESDNELKRIYQGLVFHFTDQGGQSSTSESESVDTSMQTATL